MNTTIKPGDHPMLLLGIVVLLTFGVSFLPASWFGIQPVHKKYTRIDLSNLTSVQDIARDTNEDGVTDWNEIIQQTYAGTGLEPSKNTTPDPKTVAQLNDPNNLTGSFSKNLYLASAYMQKTGVDDKATQHDLVEKLMKEEASKIEIVTYEYKDLRIDTAETPASLKEYGNKLGTLARSAIEDNLGVTDVDLFKAYVDTKSSTAYATLIDKRDTARYIASEMLTMKVPNSAYPFHLVTLNAVVKYRDTLDNILKVETDPIRGAIAFDMYVPAVTSMLRSVSVLSKYFEEEGVVFGAKEAGYVFDPRYTISN